MKQEFDFSEAISILRASDIISKIEIKNVDEIKGRGIYKVRCNLIPHHFHTKDGNIIDSELRGNVIEDLQKVLSTVKNAIKEREY